MTFDRRSALPVAAALIAGVALAPRPSTAQVSAGGGAAGALYDIVSADTSKTRLGAVLVIPDTILILPDSIMHLPDGVTVPKDFDAGAEYWYWETPSQAFPTSFLLVPSTRAALPSVDVEDYDAYDHLTYDLSDPHPMPKASVVSGVDLTYTAWEINAGAWPSMAAVQWPYDFTPEAWFIFGGGGHGAQRSWARKDLGVEVLDIDRKGEGYLFVATALPAPGSIEVVEAR